MVQVEAAWVAVPGAGGQVAGLGEGREAGLVGGQGVVLGEAYVASVPSGHLVYLGVLGMAARRVVDQEADQRVVLGVSLEELVAVLVEEAPSLVDLACVEEAAVLPLVLTQSAFWEHQTGYHQVLCPQCQSPQNQCTLPPLLPPLHLLGQTAPPS